MEGDADTHGSKSRRRPEKASPSAREIHASIGSILPLWVKRLFSNHEPFLLQRDPPLRIPADQVIAFEHCQRSSKHQIELS